MTRILVLGIGSPFGADTIGWQVIDHLERSAVSDDYLRNHVDLRREDRPGLYLLELISGYRQVILVDAVVSGAAAGTIHHLQMQDMLRERAVLSTHLAGVADALSLGAVIDMLPEKLELFGLEIGEGRLPDISGITTEILARVQELKENAPLGGAYRVTGVRR